MEALLVSLDDVSANDTQAAASGPEPLLVVARYSTVHVLCEGRAPVLINGRPARLLSELAAIGATAPWEAVAREIWTDFDDRVQLRRNFDRALARLRATLRESGVRDNLVRSDTTGSFELFLLPGDSLRDEG